MIDPDLIKGLILTTIGIFTGTGFWSWWQSRHRPTIDRDTAAVANARDASDLALAFAERADHRSSDVEARMTILEARLTRWVSWGTDIVTRWSAHRQSETPPALPE